MSLANDDKQFIHDSIKTESTRLEIQMRGQRSDTSRLENLMEDHRGVTDRILELLTDNIKTNSTVKIHDERIDRLE